MSETTFTPSPILTPEIKLPDPTHSTGIWHLGDSARITSDNPCGYYLETGGSPGSDAWQDGYFAKALPVLRKIGADTVQIWDAELHSLGKSADYVGMPEIASKINPGFNYSRFFKRLGSEGLRAGICVRVDKRIENGVQVVIPDKERFDHIRRQVLFAVREWKVSWIYVDSNVLSEPANRPGGLPPRDAEGWSLPDTAWARLDKEFPDVTFVPEHYRATSFLWSVPYHDVRNGLIDIPRYIQKDIPRAVGFFNCSGIVASELSGMLPQVKASARAGNRLAIDAWFPSPEIDVFAEVFK